jgi:opacity protein-like surface antigen
LPIGKDWSLLGRAGIAHAKFDGPTGDNSNIGPKVGAGVRYDLTKNIARAEYEHYHFRDVFDSKANVRQFTAGVKVDF